MSPSPSAASGDGIFRAPNPVTPQGDRCAVKFGRSATEPTLLHFENYRLDNIFRPAQAGTHESHRWRGSRRDEGIAPLRNYTNKIMKHTIRWVLVAVVTSLTCLLVTYRVAYHRGYWTGQVDAIHQNSGVTSLVTLGALQKIRAGDIPSATHLMETVCFGSAEVYFHAPTNNIGNGVTTTLTPELLKYRAAYRTNRADWDVMEHQLEAQLATAK